MFTHILLFGMLILLSAAGGFAGHPEDTDKSRMQSMLSQVAYFLLLFVLLAFISVVIWLYISKYYAIQSRHIIVRHYINSDCCLCVTSGG
jgi:hypothetical protein